jgi:hypothetical protein
LVLMLISLVFMIPRQGHMELASPLLFIGMGMMWRAAKL